MTASPIAPPSNRRTGSGHLGRLAAAAALFMACAGLASGLLTHLPAQAASSAHAAASDNTGAPSDWSQLSASQRQALAPLASQWATLAPSSRVKWVEVARRFHQLSPAEQARVHVR